MVRLLKEKRNFRDVLFARSLWRQNQEGLYKQSPGPQVLFFDECHFSLYTRPKTAWRRSGDPLRGIEVPEDPGKGVILVLAISLRGVEDYSVGPEFHKAVHTAKFLDRM